MNGLFMSNLLVIGGSATKKIRLAGITVSLHLYTQGGKWFQRTHMDNQQIFGIVSQIAIFFPVSSKFMQKMRLLWNDCRESILNLVLP